MEEAYWTSTVTTAQISDTAARQFASEPNKKVPIEGSTKL